MTARHGLSSPGPDEMQNGPPPWDEERLLLPPLEHYTAHETHQDATSRLSMILRSLDDRLDHFERGTETLLRDRTREAEAAAHEAFREVVGLRASHASALETITEALRCCADLRDSRSAAERAAASTQNALAVLRGQRVRAALRVPVFVGCIAALCGLVLGQNIGQPSHIDLTWKDPIEVQRFGSGDAKLPYVDPLPHLPVAPTALAAPTPITPQPNILPPGRPMPVIYGSPAVAVDARPAHQASARATAR